MFTGFRCPSDGRLYEKNNRTLVFTRRYHFQFQNQAGKVGVGDVGYHKSYDAGPVGAKPLGAHVGDVFRLPDDAADAFLCLFGKTPVLVDHTGDRRG